ncbi:PREDICTED: uncharacterized protein LOC109341280 isoform X2 [Lupinus angustifolius]|uniref:uncharacterized protein LOC109341280 isoform X2 n=1 Tax=Lupinus angustifolius TaxID=3871 RepID=UPI00092F6BE8|nr:PREDICTED: uncharacterized protein LOC109341280 isoform X2 [Lupinus angustifolius]
MVLSCLLLKQTKTMAEEAKPTNEYCSSSSEEDGDAAWKAAINSIAQTTTFVSSFKSVTKHRDSNDNNNNDDGQDHKPKTQLIKHYQIKAQKLLNDILEKTIDVVEEPAFILNEDTKTEEGGIRLFRHSQPGIVFDADEPHSPRKRPRILPGADIDEKSKKFKKRIRSVTVDGKDLMATANDACKKSLARLEAKDAAAKAKARREEERIENLKKIRGERWLPSMTNEMPVKYRNEMPVKYRNEMPVKYHR